MKLFIIFLICLIVCSCKNESVPSPPQTKSLNPTTDGVYSKRPIAPTSLKIVASTRHSLELSWEYPSGDSDEFILEIRDSNNGWSILATLFKEERYYIDDGLSMDSQYSYRIRSKISNNSSEPSNIAIGRTLPDIPTGPTQLIISQITSSSISLNWSDNSQNEAKFNVYRQLPVGQWTRIGEIEANSTQFTDTGLPEFTTIYYKITAQNISGESISSAEVVGKTLANIPVAPNILSYSTSADDPSVLTISWADRSNNEVNFYVQRKLLSAASWSDIAIIPANQTSFRDTNLNINLTFFYRVASKNSAGISYSTEYLTHTVDYLPGIPTNLRTYDGVNPSNGIELAWSPVMGAFIGQTNWVHIERSFDGITGWTEVFVWYSGPYTDRNVTSGVSYYYRVRARSYGGYSGYSQIVNRIAP